MELYAEKIEGSGPKAHPRHTLLSSDPRARLLAAILLGLGTLVCPTWPSALLFLLLALSCGLLLGPGAHSLFRALWPINFFLLFTWLTVPFSFSTSLETHNILTEAYLPLFWNLHLDHAGLMFCVLSTLKANAAAIFLLSLTHGISPATLGGALRDLGLPEKLCTLLLMTVRHIFILKEEFQASLRALRLRPKGFGILTNLKLYALFLGSVLIRSATRAEQVRMAMLCRDYNSLWHPHLFSPSEKSWRRRDSGLLFASSLPLLFILTLRLGG